MLGDVVVDHLTVDSLVRSLSEMERRRHKMLDIVRRNPLEVVFMKPLSYQLDDLDDLAPNPEVLGSYRFVLSSPKEIDELIGNLCRKILEFYGIDGYDGFGSCAEFIAMRDHGLPGKGKP